MAVVPTRVPSRRMSYPVTPVSSVDAVQARVTLLLDLAVTRRLVGTVGAWVSSSPPLPPSSGGWALRSSSWNCPENQCPATGESGRAPVRLKPLRPLPVYVGSHIRSKPLPSSLSTGSLLPSDSPGGLAQT